MTTPSEPTVEEREEQLAALRKRVRRAAKRGDKAEFDRLSAAYASLKAEHVTKVHEEYVAERRAARVVARPPVAGEAERWRRAIRRRYGAGMTAVIWRPGSRVSR
ncbi:hypothetical protein [Streptomyces sp. NBC_00620]|uniref:hypothetical protein n=1 Tax=Streptomyces sp. NBC_00620 TaxID=2903666 RepID=UPI00224D9152|nr:hypothetical protein [Streptomyces sp. NBC_00620]MCX4973151.1 hypothetical protein [Streptomyces sp. NBC_00620]